MGLPEKIVGGVMAAVILVLSIAYEVKAAEARANQLEARNARADADAGKRTIQKLNGTMYAVTTKLIGEYTVQLTAAQQQIAGVNGEKVKSDALVKVMADSLHARHDVQPVVITSIGQIVAADSLDATDTLGVKAAATVTIEPPDSAIGGARVARWDWRLTRANILLDLTMACTDQNAVAHISGPPYLNLELTKVQQDPGICLPASHWSPFSLHVPSILEVGAGVGLFVVGIIVGHK